MVKLLLILHALMLHALQHWDDAGLDPLSFHLLRRCNLPLVQPLLLLELFSMHATKFLHLGVVSYLRVQLTHAGFVLQLTVLRLSCLQGVCCGCPLQTEPRDVRNLILRQEFPRLLSLNS